MPNKSIWHTHNWIVQDGIKDPIMVQHVSKERTARWASRIRHLVAGNHVEGTGALHLLDGG